ncbi:MAG: MBL fold metallo-hydrolase [Verrucomicrobia bacterium]|nr:MBL fold metallo-hydrolase [Verrucomicrobiota bacterium]MDE3098871.1 MBL fold metallo-hydrolase [Verrucomicrobiota bacterium]
MTRLKFWGVRGSIPTPGPGTVHYGGNTSCVEVRGDGEIVILDAGTGLRLLGRALMEEFKDKPLNLTLLLTHTHWDHIHGLPFFAPVYNSKCRLRILGSVGARKGLVGALTGQMESTYFPVPFAKLPGNIDVEEFKELNFDIGPFCIRAKRANHPGLCVGYRLTTPDGVICFFPDTEPRTGGQDRDMIEFVRDADVLILDSQYDAVEYRAHMGWGHGCVDDSVRLALQAGVRTLYLFHHDPDHDDRRMEELVGSARQMAGAGTLKVEAAREGVTIDLGAKIG